MTAESVQFDVAQIKFDDATSLAVLSIRNRRESTYKSLLLPTGIGEISNYWRALLVEVQLLAC